MTSTPVRKRGRPPAAETAETRERIVEVAADLFAEKGFHGAGVAEIGDRAQVQRGALYYHIGSKEELLFEILRGYIDLVDADARLISESEGDPVDKLRRLMRSHVRLIITHRREVTIHLRDVSALTGNRARDLQRLGADVRQRWQDVMEAGYAIGALRTADRVITNSILSMLNSVIFWYHEEGEHGPDAIAELIATTVLDGLIQSPSSVAISESTTMKVEE
ncbi:TetR/AcrR family transcriptional regulator [Nocardia sp. NPDC059240]|uniref:TetR/AcrR family transcriptional regulator n=1 Tax=Nocardia sp. NPDC059240 TaxID=3346786 RepID=UPI0036B36EFB